MPADLDAAIRTALHAGEIEPADLRRPFLRADAARPGRRPWLAPVAAAFAVAALAVAVSVFLARREPVRTSVAASPLTGVTGYRWQITRVADAHGSVAVPAALHPIISFDRTQVYGDDTVNALTAGYRETTDGYALRGGAGTTDVGYAGTDPVRLRTIAAIDELFGESSTGTVAPPVAIRVRLAGDVLTLYRDAVTVAARRAGRQPVAGPASATPTSGTTSSGNAFRYLGPVPRTETVAGGELLLEPPTGTGPRLTAAQAFGRWCAAHSAACGSQSERAQIVLARLTTPQSGHERKDGTIRPAALRVLSYILVWHNVDCPDYGGSVPAPGTTPSPRPHLSNCTETDPVDANTGKTGGQYYS